MSTEEIIERVELALAYLEDGAREAGLQRLWVIVEKNRDEILLANFDTLIRGASA